MLTLFVVTARFDNIDGWTSEINECRSLGIVAATNKKEARAIATRHYAETLELEKSDLNLTIEAIGTANKGLVQGMLHELNDSGLD